MDIRCVLIAMLSNTSDNIEMPNCSAHCCRYVIKEFLVSQGDKLPVLHILFVRWSIRFRHVFFF